MLTPQVKGGMCSKVPLYSRGKGFSHGSRMVSLLAVLLEGEVSDMAKERGSNQRLPWIFTLALGTFFSLDSLS